MNDTERTSTIPYTDTAENLTNKSEPLQDSTVETIRTSLYDSLIHGITQRDLVKGKIKGLRKYAKKLEKRLNAAVQHPKQHSWNSSYLHLGNEKDRKRTQQRIEQLSQKARGLIAKIDATELQARSIEFLPNIWPVYFESSFITLSMKLSYNKETVEVDVLNNTGYKLTQLLLIETSSREVISCIESLDPQEEKTLHIDPPYELLQTQRLCRFIIVHCCVAVSDVFELGVCRLSYSQGTVRITNNLICKLQGTLLLENSVIQEIEVAPFKTLEVQLDLDGQEGHLMVYEGQQRISPLIPIN